MHDDIDPTPEGLLRCLQVLSEEAAFLSLPRTFAALVEAIGTCHQESSTSAFGGSQPIRAGLVH